MLLPSRKLSMLSRERILKKLLLKDQRRSKVFHLVVHKLLPLLPRLLLQLLKLRRKHLKRKNLKKKKK
jgi:hypothetical protein